MHINVLGHLWHLKDVPLKPNIHIFAEDNLNFINLYQMGKNMFLNCVN